MPEKVVITLLFEPSLPPEAVERMNKTLGLGLQIVKHALPVPNDVEIKYTIEAQ